MKISEAADALARVKRPKWDLKNEQPIRLPKGDVLELSPKARDAAPGAANQLPAPSGSSQAVYGQPPTWVKDAVFYQVFPERFANGNPHNDPAGVENWNTGTPTFNNYFGGDIQGVIDHLPYLKDLGVNALYFNPLFTSPSNHKYKIQDYMQIDPEFGNLQDFDNLIAAAHQNGMKVILDGVFNHTSDQNAMFQDAIAKGPGSSHWNDYLINNFPVQDGNAAQYATYGGFGDMPQLNVAGNPATQKYLLSAVDFWTRRGIDGWRLDVPLNIQSDAFWHDFRSTVKGINPDAYIVGEAWQNHGDNPIPWVQGDKFDAVMNYQFYQYMHDFFAHDNINADSFDMGLMSLRNQWSPQVNNSEFNLLGSHDTSRFLYEAGGDTSRLKLAYLWQMHYPGAPVIYYGDEIGMNGGNDPLNRAPMAWNNVNTDVHDYVKKLIGIRRQHGALRGDGQFDSLMRNNDLGQIVTYRTDGKETFLGFFNKGQTSSVTLDTTTNNLAKIPIPDGTKFKDLLNGGTYQVAGGKLTVNVGPENGTLLQQVP